MHAAPSAKAPGNKTGGATRFLFEGRSDNSLALIWDNLVLAWAKTRNTALMVAGKRAGWSRLALQARL
jgi:hypothetical protein